MFIKTIVKTDKKSGTRYEYLRLCESYHIIHSYTSFEKGK